MPPQDSTQAATRAAEPGDGALLRAWLAGDEAAYAQLYDRHDRRCFEFIRRMLATADDATTEDLHQDVWLTVARQAGSYDEQQARFVTWLFTIARNKVMDHYRKASGVVRLAADLDPNLPHTLEAQAPAAVPTPEAIAQNRELGDALLREVAALPFVQRETFVLFAQQELSLEAVAEITRVGIETAKSRLRYARQTLRSRLAIWRDRDETGDAR